MKVLCYEDSFISVDTGKQYLVLVPQLSSHPPQVKRMHQTVPLLLSYISVTEQQHRKKYI